MRPLLCVRLRVRASACACVCVCVRVTEGGWAGWASWEGAPWEPPFAQGLSESGSKIHAPVIVGLATCISARTSSPALCTAVAA